MFRKTLPTLDSSVRPRGSDFGRREFAVPQYTARFSLLVGFGGDGRYKFEFGGAVEPFIRTCSDRGVAAVCHNPDRPTRRVPQFQTQRPAHGQRPAPKATVRRTTLREIYNLQKGVLDRPGRVSLPNFALGHEPQQHRQPCGRTPEARDTGPQQDQDARSGQKQPKPVLRPPQTAGFHGVRHQSSENCKVLSESLEVHHRCCPHKSQMHDQKPDHRTTERFGPLENRTHHRQKSFGKSRPLRPIPHKTSRDISRALPIRVSVQHRQVKKNTLTKKTHKAKWRQE